MVSSLFKGSGFRVQGSGFPASPSRLRRTSRVQGSAQPPAKKTAGQIEKETLACAIVGSATVPTSFGGHGGPPYGPKHLKFHTSAAAGLKSGQSNRERNFGLCHRRVGHRADQFRRARWPALRSQLCVVSYKVSVLTNTSITIWCFS